MQLHIIEKKEYYDISEVRDTKKNDIEIFARIKKIDYLSIPVDNKGDREFCIKFGINFIIAGKKSGYKIYTTLKPYGQIYVSKYEYDEKIAASISKKKEKKAEKKYSLQEAKDFYKCMDTLSCLYIIFDPKSEIKVGSDQIVCKFGRTINLQQRLSKHALNFDETAHLYYICPINEIYTNNAEKMLNSFFKEIGQPVQKYKEIFIVPKNSLNSIKNKMKEISLKYSSISLKKHQKTDSMLFKLIFNSFFFWSFIFHF
jgi:hypothetical protein